MALDLGTTTGWATCDLSGNITSGTASFKTGRFEGGGMPFCKRQISCILQKENNMI